MASASGAVADSSHWCHCSFTSLLWILFAMGASVVGSAQIVSDELDWNCAQQRLIVTGLSPCRRLPWHPCPRRLPALHHRTTTPAAAALPTDRVAADLAANLIAAALLVSLAAPSPPRLSLASLPLPPSLQHRPCHLLRSQPPRIPSSPTYPSNRHLFQALLPHPELACHSVMWGLSISSSMCF